MRFELGGHSGCKIELIEDCGSVRVRKTSANEGYNVRLINQFNKQFSMKFGSIYVTPVLGSGYADGCFYFDMQYICGKTLSEYIRTAPLFELKHISKILTDHMEFNHPFDVNAKDVFILKIKSVIGSIKESEAYISGSYPNFCNLIEQSETTLLNYSWQYISNTPCHGDFTLENLMITGDQKIFAIDLLDSFYDSWQIDFAKILQDVELGWSSRHDSFSENLFIRNKILKQCVFECIPDSIFKKDIVISIYHVLLLNILRIVPYSQDDVTVNHLVHNMDYLLKKLNYLVKI